MTKTTKEATRDYSDVTNVAQGINSISANQVLGFQIKKERHKVTQSAPEEKRPST